MDAPGRGAARQLDLAGGVAVSERISIADLRERIEGHYWLEQSEVIAALVDAVEAAHRHVKAVAADDRFTHQHLAAILDRFDFGESA